VLLLHLLISSTTSSRAEETVTPPADVAAPSAEAAPAPAPAAAAAENADDDTPAGMDFLAKVALGHKSSELVIRDRRFTPEFVTLDIALTVGMRGLFVTLDNDLSVKDAIETDPNGLIFYSRHDMNLTLGYSFSSFSVFTGWRTGETKAHYTGSNNAFGTRSEGYYVGTGGAYSFGESGQRLYGSIAVARLEGEVTLTEPLVDTSAFALGNAPSEIKGTSVGVSATLGWSGPLSERATWHIEYKLNQFAFEDDEKFGGLDLSYEENFQTLYLGVTHFF
jgi:hypothetical protein